MEMSAGATAAPAKSGHGKRAHVAGRRPEKFCDDFGRDSDSRALRIMAVNDVDDYYSRS